MRAPSRPASGAASGSAGALAGSAGLSVGAVVGVAGEVGVAGSVGPLAGGAVGSVATGGVAPGAGGLPIDAGAAPKRGGTPAWRASLDRARAGRFTTREKACCMGEALPSPCLSPWSTGTLAAAVERSSQVLFNFFAAWSHVCLRAPGVGWGSARSLCAPPRGLAAASRAGVTALPPPPPAVGWRRFLTRTGQVAPWLGTLPALGWTRFLTRTGQVAPWLRTLPAVRGRWPMARDVAGSRFGGGLDSCGAGGPWLETLPALGSAGGSKAANYGGTARVPSGCWGPPAVGDMRLSSVDDTPTTRLKRYLREYMVREISSGVGVASCRAGEVDQVTLWPPGRPQRHFAYVSCDCSFSDRLGPTRSRARRHPAACVAGADGRPL